MKWAKLLRSNRKGSCKYPTKGPCRNHWSRTMQPRNQSKTNPRCNKLINGSNYSLLIFISALSHHTPSNTKNTKKKPRRRRNSKLDGLDLQTSFCYLMTNKKYDLLSKLVYVIWCQIPASTNIGTTLKLWY